LCIWASPSSSLYLLTIEFFIYFLKWD
jgi:hypothetical protein